jgi:hypothetical protein
MLIHIMQSMQILQKEIRHEAVVQEKHLRSSVVSIHLVRLQVLMAASMKMTVFWDVVPCSLVQVYRRFRCVYWLHHHPDDGGSKHP